MDNKSIVVSQGNKITDNRIISEKQEKKRIIIQRLFQKRMKTLKIKLRLEKDKPQEEINLNEKKSSKEIFTGQKSNDKL